MTHLQPSKTGLAGCVEEGEGSILFSSLLPKFPMDTSTSTGFSADSRSQAPLRWQRTTNLRVPRNLWGGLGVVVNVN